MKTKNNIHTPPVDAETLRGTGKFGWTEGGKMHSTFKRLSESLVNDDVVRQPPSKKKQEVKCPKCGKTFKTNNPNVIPPHKPYRPWYSFGNTETTDLCSQKKDWREPPEVKEKGKQAYINGEWIKKNDKVIFSTYPNYVSFQTREELKEHTIEDVYLMDNGALHLKLVGIDETVPCNYFVKNLIKA